MNKNTYEVRLTDGQNFLVFAKSMEVAARIAQQHSDAECKKAGLGGDWPKTEWPIVDSIGTLSFSAVVGR